MNTAATTTQQTGRAKPALDVHQIRKDFPILHQTVHGEPLVYLDSAATAQKPKVVLDALAAYYNRDNANVHRGVHELSVRATRSYEQAREKVQRFLGAARREEIVFVRSATEAINLVAQTWGRTHLRSGDEVIVSEMEHHSNIVPWQILCEQKDAHLRVVPINDRGELIFEEYKKLLGPKTRIVAVGHVSNALGTINPLREIIALAREAGAVTVIDGAQAAPHLTIDVQQLGCDFYAISGHKMYGPTGIGVLYGRYELLDTLPPYQGGGEMIKSVTFEKTIYNDLPHKFEAGTPHIAGAVGLGAAVDYLTAVGLDVLAAHEHDVLAYATEKLAHIPQIRLIGTAEQKAAVISFVIDGVHPHDLGTCLDHDGIAVRTGHHCAQPVMAHFGVAATARASLGLYNSRDDIDVLAASLRKVIEVFT